MAPLLYAQRQWRIEDEIARKKELEEDLAFYSKCIDQEKINQKLRDRNDKMMAETIEKLRRQNSELTKELHRSN